MDPLNTPAKCEIRSFTHSWDNRGYPKNFGSPWIRLHSLFSKFFNGILYGWTSWMYRPNLKSVALPVPEIIGGTSKIKTLGSPVYAHAAFSPQFLMGFCSDGPCEWNGHGPNLKSMKLFSMNSNLYVIVITVGLYLSKPRSYFSRNC